jgi:hypothetical protein
MLDAQFLIDSGLLFEINRTIMHPLGMALGFKQEEGKELKVVIRDCRPAPEQTVFSDEVYKAGVRKLRKFMRAFGDNQLRQRYQKLGWGVQSYYVTD